MFNLLKDTIREWREDGANRLAAALAYYTTFSLAPLLVLIIAIAGLAGGREAAQTQTMAQVEDLLGTDQFHHLLHRHYPALWHDL